MSPQAPVVPRRPLRRDAEQNRARMLAAAEQVFAEHGLDVSVDCLIEAAGVGTGTFYRRFPDKQALIDELVGDLLDSLTDLAQRSLDDVGDGLEVFLRSACRELQGHRAFLRRIWQYQPSSEQVATVRRLVRELLDGAQRAGRIAAGVTVADISMVMWAVSGIIDAAADVEPAIWERHLDVVLRGMRQPDLAYSRSSLSAEQLSGIGCHAARG